MRACVFGYEFCTPKGPLQKAFLSLKGSKMMLLQKALLFVARSQVKPLHFVEAIFGLWTWFCSPKMGAPRIVAIKRLHRCTPAIWTRIPKPDLILQSLQNVTPDIGDGAILPFHVCFWSLASKAIPAMLVVLKPVFNEIWESWLQFVILEKREPRGTLFSYTESMHYMYIYNIYIFILYLYVHIYIYICVCVHIDIYIYMCVYIYICVYIFFIDVYIYIYMYMCMCVYIYM